MLKIDISLFLQNINMLTRQLFLLLEKSTTFWDNPRRYVVAPGLRIKNPAAYYRSLITNKKIGQSQPDLNYCNASAFSVNRFKITAIL